MPAFLRRVSLDLTGQLPTPEGGARVRRRLPSKTKRSRMIDKLIASSAYVDHWTLKWGDLLQNSRKYLGEKGAYEFREWIRESIAQNKPYDRMVREMLTARGSSYENPAANFFRVTRDPKPTMEKTTQVFLGVRMVCAQCHDHPFERWTQNQYYEMAAFFSAVGLRPGYEVGEEIVYDQRAGYRHEAPQGRPRDEAEVHPAGQRRRHAPVPPTDQRRRAWRYAEWLTAKDNPFFAKSIANRVWSYFFGRGIIDPVDDIRASNPPEQPGAAGRADEGFRGSRFRPAAPDAHHRQLAHLPGVHRDQRMERERQRELLARHAAAAERRGVDGCAGAGHRRAAGISGGAAGYDAPSR